MHYRRLPLQGLCNARDLGGYPAENGRITKFGAFIRSEVPSHLTPEDMDFLKNYGVKMSIDFRGARELEKAPSRMAAAGWAEYRHCPMFNETVARGAGLEQKGPVKPVPDGDDLWKKMYVSMAEEHKSWVKSALETAAGCSGAVMYNCTTGKDRTGMFSAFLLAIAGVGDLDIIADYCVSQVYLRPMYSTMFHLLPGRATESGPDLSDPFFKTQPENMETLLEHFNKNYGGTRAYLASCGVTEDVMELLRNKLV